MITHPSGELSCSAAEVIEQSSRRIHEPQADVTTIGIEGPGRDAARRDQCSIPIDFHDAIGTSACSELIAIRERDWDIRAALHPILGGMIGPYLDIVSDTVILEVNQTGGGCTAALRFQDQAMLIARCRIDLREGDIGFLVRSKGGSIPQNVCVPAASRDIQLIGRDGKGAGVTGPTASNGAVGAVEVIAHNSNGETTRAGACWGG